MDRPILLGLTGKRGSGKDTAFGFIDDWAGNRGLLACRRSFADKLKHSAALALGFAVEESDAVVLMDELKTVGEITTIIPGQSIAYTIDGRKFLQLYGTEAHRNVFGKDFWVNALLPDQMRPEEEGWVPVWHDNFLQADVCVIADVRFENEARRIKELGGSVWSIERETGISDDHASEAGLPSELIDLVIPNHGTLNEFELEVRATMTGEYHMRFVEKEGERL